MPIVVVDTDFVVHKEDEQWTAEEIEFMQAHIADENANITAHKRHIPIEVYQQMAQALSNGDIQAWKMLDA